MFQENVFQELDQEELMLVEGGTNWAGIGFGAIGVIYGGTQVVKGVKIKDVNTVLTGIAEIGAGFSFIWNSW